MKLPTFENSNPIVEEDGTIWDLYWMTTLIISTNIETNQPTAYTEFWPCRVVVLNGVESKEIKKNIQGNEVKSIIVEDLFKESESNPFVGQILTGIMELLKQIGIQQGIFKNS